MIKKTAVLFLVILGSGAWAQFSTFSMVDNFEGGNADKWYRFGNVEMSVVKNPSQEARDAVAESCGEYSLQLKGGSDNWYIGGIGTDLRLDATPYSRLQMDIYGSEAGGKLKIELFDDDNKNAILEQDSGRDWLATRDDKWVAEVPVMGRGWMRVSIPFTAFKLENPGSGDGIWNPDQNDGSGGLLKMQIILLTASQKGDFEAKLDNILLTY
jgi:hypothetical protein